MSIVKEDKGFKIIIRKEGKATLITGWMSKSTLLKFLSETI